MFIRSLIEERKEELDMIETVMMDVNKITLDLAVEVKRQDEKLECVGDNVRHSKKNTEKAYYELEKSEKSQESSHSKM